MRAWALPLALAVGLVAAARGAAPLVPDPDAALLREAGLATDTPALLTFLRDGTPDDRDVGRVEALVKQLGDDAFDEREDASRRLVRLGGYAVPALKKARGRD